MITQIVAFKRFRPRLSMVLPRSVTRTLLDGRGVILFLTVSYLHSSGFWCAGAFSDQNTLADPLCDARLT